MLSCQNPDLATELIRNEFGQPGANCFSLDCACLQLERATNCVQVTVCDLHLYVHTPASHR